MSHELVLKQFKTDGQERYGVEFTPEVRAVVDEIAEGNYSLRGILEDLEIYGGLTRLQIHQMKLHCWLLHENMYTQKMPGGHRINPLVLRP